MDWYLCPETLPSDFPFKKILLYLAYKTKTLEINFILKLLSVYKLGDLEFVEHLPFLNNLNSDDSKNNRLLSFLKVFEFVGEQ